MPGRLFRGILLLGVLAYPGCLAKEDRHLGAGPVHSHTPESYQSARFLETLALEELTEGNRLRNPERRRTRHDAAIRFLRRARLLLEEELLGSVPNLEQDEYLEAVIERLSHQIADIHRLRPSG